MLKQLIRAWRHARLLNRYIASADAEGAWNDRNAADLAAFFSTETGQLFKDRLQNYVFRAAVAATQSAGDAGYHCGVARGVAMTVNVIQDHFLPALRQQEDTEETVQMPDNATALAAVLSP